MNVCMPICILRFDSTLFFPQSSFNFKISLYYYLHLCVVRPELYIHCRPTYFYLFIYFKKHILQPFAQKNVTWSAVNKTHLCQFDSFIVNYISFSCIKLFAIFVQDPIYNNSCGRICLELDFLLVFHLSISPYLTADKVQCDTLSVHQTIGARI